MATESKWMDPRTLRQLIDHSLMETNRRHQLISGSVLKLIWSNLIRHRSSLSFRIVIDGSFSHSCCLCIYFCCGWIDSENKKGNEARAKADFVLLQKHSALNWRWKKIGETQSNNCMREKEEEDAMPRTTIKRKWEREKEKTRKENEGKRSKRETLRGRTSFFIDKISSLDVLSLMIRSDIDQRWCFPHDQTNLSERKHLSTKGKF